MGSREYLTKKEICAYFGFCGKTWERLVAARIAPAGYHFGKRLIRWSRQDLEQWVESRRFDRTDVPLGSTDNVDARQIGFASKPGLPVSVPRVAKSNPAIPDAEYSDSLQRFQILDFAQRLAPRGRLAKCLRSRCSRSEKPKMNFVGAGKHQRLWFQGLRKCDKSYCPVCSENWGRELERKLQGVVDRLKNTNATVRTLTFTMRHSPGDRLENLLAEIRCAWKEFWRSHSIRNCAKKHGLKMHGWVLEITYSNEGGWHVHFHCLVSWNHENFDFEVVREQWGASLASVDRGASDFNGVVACKLRENVASYLAKEWTQLQAKNSSSLSPLQLGYRACLTENENDIRLYDEFLTAMSSGSFRRFYIRGGAGSSPGRKQKNVSGEFRTYEISIADLRLLRIGQPIAKVAISYLRSLDGD